MLLDLKRSPQITNEAAAIHLTKKPFLLIFENTSPKVARATQGMLSICRVRGAQRELQNTQIRSGIVIHFSA